jgi:hypothetical protein
MVRNYAMASHITVRDEKLKAGFLSQMDNTDIKRLKMM